MTDFDPTTTEATFDDAVREWRRQLVDLGGANTLLWSGRSLQLDLGRAHPAGIAKLFSRRSVRLSELYRQVHVFPDAARQARNLGFTATSLWEERGLDCLHVAVGEATWDLTDERGHRPKAPVVLYAATLTPVSGDAEDLTLTISENALINPALLSYLQHTGADVDGDALHALAGAASGSDPRQVFEEITRSAEHIPGLRVGSAARLALFNLTKSDLVADLMGDLGPWAHHPVLGALGGDLDLASALAAPPPAYVAADHLRQTTPFLLDAEQAEAVQAGLAGAQLFLQASAGTGGTQTVAALVAEAARENRPVLLTAQRPSALTDVRDRLAAAGLDDLVIHLDGAAAYEEFADRFTARIQQALAADTADPAPRDEPDLGGVLQEHHQALHTPWSPWGVTLAAAIDRITELGTVRPAPRSHVRLSGDDLLALSGAQHTRVTALLTDLARRGAWDTSGANDPWFGADVSTRGQADRAEQLLDDLLDERLPRYRREVDEIFDGVGLPAPSSLHDEADCLALLHEVAGVLEVFRPEVYEAPLDELAAATGNREYRASGGLDLGMMQRRRLVQQAQSLLRPGPRPDVHRVLVLALRQRERWRAIAGPGSRPRPVPDLNSVRKRHDALVEDLEWLGARMPGEPDLLDFARETLQATLGRFRDRVDRLRVLPDVHAELGEIEAIGLRPLVEDLARRHVPPEQVPVEADFVWWTSLFEHVTGRQEVLTGDEIRPLLDRFGDLTAAELAENAAGIRRAMDDRLSAMVRALPDQVREIQQGFARREPLPQLMARGAEILFAVAPIWAVSPYTVPAWIGRGTWFDMTVLLDAGRCTTAAAVPALSRANQCVLVGDRSLLPPVSIGLDGREPEHSDVMASVVDDLAPLVTARSLTTDYRSADPRLVEFVSAVGNLDPIRAYPVPAGTPRPLRLDVVRDDRGAAAQAEHVVRLAISHVRNEPGATMLVVTFTTDGAERLRATLLREAAAAGCLDEVQEQVRVLPVVAAQGVTADVAVIVVGMRLDDDGVPVGASARELVRMGAPAVLVAATRSLHRIVVVSGFDAEELAVSGLRAPGLSTLRDLLVQVSGVPQGQQRAAAPAKPKRRRRTASTGSVLDRPVATTKDALRGALVEDLVRRLRSEGLSVEVIGDVGVAPDLVIAGAGVPVAVDVDTSAVRPIEAVHERDVIRPQELRRRGFRYERVVAADVFRDPAREVARLVAIAGRPVRGASDD